MPTTQIVANEGRISTPDSVLIKKRRLQQGILQFAHLDIPMGELTCLNLAACKRLLIQHFDLHIVSELQGTKYLCFDCYGEPEETIYVCLRTHKDGFAAKMLGLMIGLGLHDSRLVYLG